ncbi:unnamed protein product [Calicophoron daubneyi]|uniref:C3H1-type domain-containing protein n=1 Tax=Calicophoron daubneyi TaxID=300641 RepID=A0AAV2SYW1_CALDB
MGYETTILVILLCFSDFMGRRFHCDYCDKSFPDNPVNRRNHLKGIQHQQARKLHYDQYLGPKERLQAERLKKPCIAFQRRGECSYGPLCRFSHLTPEMLRQLEHCARLESRESQLISLASEENINIQLNKLEQVVLRRRAMLDSLKKQDGRGFKLPPGFEFSQLPPSLCFLPDEVHN